MEPTGNRMEVIRANSSLEAKDSVLRLTPTPDTIGDIEARDWTVLDAWNKPQPLKIDFSPL